MVRISTSRQTHRFGMIHLLGTALLAVGIGLAPSALADDEAEDDEIGQYLVEDGKVDPDTYQGYLVYTRACQACHGPDGLGSSFAPSLVRASERRPFAEFAQTIAAGREVQPGQVMPSFADDTYVIGNIENIYRYMKARAAGDVGRGRPQVIEHLEEEAEEAPENGDEG